MDKEAREHGGSGRAAHGRRDVRVGEEGAALLQDGTRLWHEFQRAQLHVLVVRHHEDDVGLLGRLIAPPIARLLPGF